MKLSALSLVESEFRHKDILSMSQFDLSDIRTILDTAQVMKDISKRDVKKLPTLRGKEIVNCFLESSTRTRSSFEIAGKRLSADVINMTGSSSSISKGESLKDTMLTLQAMSPDLITLRSSESGAAELAANWLDIPLINAGDGRHEHPSQALLDLFTIEERFGKLAGLKVMILGDISNSRVARSNLIGMRTVGIESTVVAPFSMLPPFVDRMADHVMTDLKEAIRGIDLVIALRIQNERILALPYPSIEEYTKQFQLNEKILKLSGKETVVLHPGPVNRGVEISSDLADSLNSMIPLQVANGVAIRMALFFLVLQTKSR